MLVALEWHSGSALRGRGGRTPSLTCTTSMEVEQRAIGRLLTTLEVADLLRVSEVTVRRLVRERRIAVVRVGRSVRFEEGEVARYLDRQRVDAV